MVIYESMGKWGHPEKLSDPGIRRMSPKTAQTHLDSQLNVLPSAFLTEARSILSDACGHQGVCHPT